jgi:pilus assembly protein CpaB
MATDTHLPPGASAPRLAGHTSAPHLAGNRGWTPSSPLPAEDPAGTFTAILGHEAPHGRRPARRPVADPTPARGRGSGSPSADARRRRERARALRLAIARFRPLILLVCAAAALLATARALAPPATPTRPVLVAAHDLGAGHVLGAGDLHTVDWPAHLSPPPGDPSTTPGGAVLGRTLATALRAGEPVTDARLLGPGVLAGQPPGSFAVPVRLADPTTAGFVTAGDRVDVIAGTATDVPGFEGGPARTDVVASDVVVIAVPGRGTSGDAAGSGGGLSALTGGSGPADATDGGLLVVATDRATAVRLAGAQAGRVLSIAVRGSPGDDPPE